MKLGIMVSGRGSNLEAVLDAVADGRLAGLEPAVVVSNRPGVRAVELAARHGVPVRILRRADFETAAERDRAIGQVLTQASVQLALLAGYDQLLRPSYFEAYAGPTINIHPSLLPRHGGAGMMGDAVHRSVLEAGDEWTGVTIHEVSAELDAGPPLMRVEVPVLPDDSVARLAERVLAVEHRSVVEVLQKLMSGSVSASHHPGR
jgi:phosphoribosylglycinamide formyltransferase-1